MFTKETYISRRERVSQKVESGLLLFMGNSEAACNYAGNDYKFRQDSTFLYFFGIDIPDLAAIIDVESGEQIVFGNDVDINDIVWMGPQKSIAEQAAEVGITKTMTLDKLESVVRTAIAKGRRVHYLPPYRNHNKIVLSEIFGLPISILKDGASVEFIKAVAALRLIKEDCEIVEIEKACNLGYEMHMSALKNMRLGMVEQELVGIMESVCHSKGYFPSFPTILSQHGETLHNHKHDGVFTDGRLCVIDAGAEIASHYCSDFTRTLPTGGKFTQQQKEIYNIVASANNLAADMCRPGITYADVHIATSLHILEGLKELGLVKGDTEEALDAGTQALFMPHGLGHNMGLDVHDMEDLGEQHVGYDDKHKRAAGSNLKSLRMGKALEPGHVITDEPGIYFIPALIEEWKVQGKCKEFVNFERLEPYYNFGGIRLEDDLLITADGYRRLGNKRLPITVEDVEREMQQ